MNGEVDSKSVKVLYIDDEPEITRAVQAYFISAGFVFEVENSSVKALARVKTFRPDVILLDVVMPELDGVSLCKKLKEDPETRGIPVILLTGNDAGYEAAKIFKTGNELLIEKPFLFEKLIDNVLELYNSPKK
jgi:CheY-like chemotaxis protein